jgi:predicted nucleic acid-binding protein
MPRSRSGSAVFRECTIPGKPQTERLEGYLRAKVVEVNLNEFVIVAAGLGQGELEAMALCKRLPADHLLVDDERARKIASLNSIKVVGSLGILLRAKAMGLISAVRPSIDRMQTAGIHYSEQLVAEALRLAGESR